MIKEITVQEKVVTQHRYCDVCDTEINHSLACTNAKCKCCRKDLCENCIGHEEETGADYRDVWCRRCWDFGAEYRPKIESLNRATEALYDEWHKKCSTVEGKYKLGCKHS
jgi:hypothetical protein